MLFYFKIFTVIPQIFPFIVGDDDVNEGDTISVQCTISKGDVPLNITWTLNGKPVSYYSGIVINTGKRVSSLLIESVEGIHSGEYVCYASNKAGTSSYSSFLNIKGI